MPTNRRGGGGKFVKDPGLKEKEGKSQVNMSTCPFEYPSSMSSSGRRVVMLQTPFGHVSDQNLFRTKCT